jgi:hypothetical protein
MIVMTARVVVVVVVDALGPSSGLDGVLYVCSEHGPICHLFELILVIHANTSNGTNHIV